MNTYEVTITGKRSIMFHNVRLSDPLDPYTKLVKKYSSINKKSDQDHLDLAEAEFRGGMYYDDKVGPYIPCKLLQKTLIEGARVNTLGKQFEVDVEIDEPIDLDGYKLEYKGPRTQEALFKGKFYDRSVVTVGQSKVVRTRSCFPRGWTCTFRVVSMEDLVDEDKIRLALDNAGARKGLGDWRPKFGRFEVTNFKKI